MKQLSIKTGIWNDARFCKLVAATKWSPAKALGALALLWSHTRERANGQVASVAIVHEGLALAGLKPKPASAALIDAGFLLHCPGGYDVLDNHAHFQLREKLCETGKKGGYRTHKKRKSPVKAKAKAKAQKDTFALPTQKPRKVASSSEAWAAYAEAYVNRYGVMPVRNARVNGQLANIVACVGAEAAPALVRFYVQHDGVYYVRCQHDLGGLVKDYAGLHTQMRRNIQVTEHDLRAHSDGGRLEAQLRRLSVG